MGPASGAHILARILEAIAVLACGVVLWKLRRNSAEDSAFGLAAALVLALTSVVVPMSAPYNQILLVPTILFLVRARTNFLSGSTVQRFSYHLGILLVGWQWLASLCLSVIYILSSREWAVSNWKWPLFTSLALPVWVFALILVYAHNHLAEVRQRRTQNPSIAEVN
jgi:hypothetical protein